MCPGQDDLGWGMGVSAATRVGETRVGGETEGKGGEFFPGRIGNYPLLGMSGEKGLIFLPLQLQ